MSSSEAIHPPCVTNESCRQGEWCAPALRDDVYSMPGRCSDCYKALFAEEYYAAAQVDWELWNDLNIFVFFCSSCLDSQKPCLRRVASL